MTKEEQQLKTLLPLIRIIILKSPYGRKYFDDLYALCMYEVWKSLKTYDPTKSPLEYYVAYKVKYILLEQCRSDGGFLSGTSDVSRLYGRILKAQEELQTTTGQKPTTQEIASYLSLTIKRVTAALEWGTHRNPISLETSIIDDGLSLSETIQEGGSYLTIEDKLDLTTILNQLPSRWKSILFSHCEGYSNVEISLKHNVSEGRISQILTKTRKRVKEIASATGYNF